MRGRTLLAALAAAGSLIVGLALAEGALRLYTAVDGGFGGQLRAFDPLAVLVEPHGELGYRQKPGSTYRYSNGTAATANPMGFRGPPVPIPKPPGRLRILLLGGSTTHGWGVHDSLTIDAHMRDLLADRLAGRPVDVVNLAFDGYDSYQLYERLRSEGLALEPDLVIVNTGVNDVRNARYRNLRDRDPRTLIWETELRRLRLERERGGPALDTRLKHHFYLLRLASILHTNLRRRGRVQAAAAVTTPHPEAAAYFERNLRRIAELAAARAIPIVFSTPPSALDDAFPPDATSRQDYWIKDAATTQRYRDTLSARMRHVSEDLVRGGAPVTYVAPEVPADQFLDDAHLTGAGNRTVAKAFVEAALPLLAERLRR